MAGLGFLPVVASLESKTKQGPEPPTAGQQEDIELKLAPAPTIHNEIAAVYDKAEAAGEKPPNVREIVGPTQKRLHALGFRASGNQIMQLAGDDRHKNRRRKVGVRWGTKER